MDNAQLSTAPDPLAAIVDQQIADKPAPHPDLAALAREAVNPEPAEQFDPAIHESDPATGGPAFTKEGKLKRKRGRRPGSNSFAIAGGEPGPDGLALDGLPPATCTPAQARREAKIIAGGAFKGLQCLGEKWQPTAEEEEGVLKPLAELIQERGGLGMPPWVEVAAAFAGYIVCRLNLAPILARYAPALAGLAAGPAAGQLPDAGAADGAIAPAPDAPPIAVIRDGAAKQVSARPGVSGGDGFAFGGR